MKINPNAVRSKDSMTEALMTLMQEQPYREIPIRAITERAGLSRQTFYLNFRDKDEVIERKLTEVFETLMQHIALKRVRTVSELVETYTSAVEENAPFFQLLAVNGLTGLACRLFSEKLAQRPPVLDSQRENRTEAERRYFNVFWVAAFVETYAQWLREERRTDRSEINRIIIDIMLGNYFRPTGGEQARNA